MLNSISARSNRARRVRSYAVIACIMLVAALAPAFGQTTFKLTASTPNPFAVVPGGKSASNLTVTSTSASAVDVALSCQVTPVEATATPTCDVSPPSATTPASPSLTIATSGTTPAALYTITITAVDQNSPSNTVMVPVNLSVLAVTGDYTITVTTPVTPSTVTAGSGATAGITVTSLNGYSGAVTLSCSAVTPAVEFGPTCSFPGPVSVTGNAAQVGTLTITTLGTTTTTTTTAAISHPLRAWYALWLPLPGMALVALGCGRKKLLAVLAPYVLALGLLLLPACGNSNNNSSTTATTGVTPKNTYTLTITGADANAIAPSNGTQTVTLTVN
jgi:uncharacterized protein